MTLRTRLALFVAVAVAIAVAGVSYFAYAVARTQVLGEVDEALRMRGVGAGLGQFLDVQGQSGSGQGQTGDAPGGEFVRDDAVVQFITTDGIYQLGRAEVVLPVDDSDLAVLSGSTPSVLRDLTIDGVHYRMITRPFAPGVALQVARDLSEADSVLAGMRLRLLLLGGGGVALAAAAGWWVARRSMRPVAALTLAAEHVAETHQLDAAIPVDRNDEMGRLATAFNDMLGALEEARASQRRLVADASHELRTPLTSLRTNVELLARKGGVPEAERPAVLADVSTELGELTHIVEELVDLSTMGREQEPIVAMDLAEVVDRLVGRASRRGDVEISSTVEPTPVEAPPTAIARAVSNLIDNAVKWGGGRGPIEVTLAGRTLAVRDHGPGIDPDDVPHVFDRFYRSPTARAMPGSGLGLSIVADVVAGLGGTVFAGPADGGGARVGFTLPVA
ncbi:MAG: HAMP domain-containing sensor histidine kinase [Actinomycetota bacterium]